MTILLLPTWSIYVLLALLALTVFAVCCLPLASRADDAFGRDFKPGIDEDDAGGSL